MRALWTFLGFSITTVSALFIIAFAVDFIEGSDTEPGILIGLLIFFLLTGLGGIHLIRVGRQNRREKQERLILEIAAKKGGRITPAEIAMESPLSAEEAQNILEILCKGGNAELQVTDSGALVYVFHGLLSDTEKATSKDPLNR